VQDITIRLQHGVYGLLGENGAGKTTLMRMICGILEPTQGSILCDGMRIQQMGGAFRSLLGYLPQDFGYYEDFSAYRFLHYMAALKALPEDYARDRIDELLEVVDLEAVKHKKLKTFSGGMIRRIGIAQALLNNPEILVLDEPTSGLDPKERVRFRNIISSLGKNRLIILSTHIVSDVEYIADQIMIMKNGKMIRTGTEEEIAGNIKNCVWKCLVSEKEVMRLNENYIVSNLKNQGDQVELRIVSEEKPVPDAEQLAMTLEDIYLYCIQND
ncbi:MAG: ATP-binding cassette domain-containing protein, partial [Lachnospiraceae bacterium]|nr:ATP-binding cassette domain-containing protein [Lachnospiraceae bacterium]